MYIGAMGEHIESTAYPHGVPQGCRCGAVLDVQRISSSHSTVPVEGWKWVEQAGFTVLYNGTALTHPWSPQEALDTSSFWLYIIDILYNPNQGRQHMSEIKYMTRGEQGKLLKAIDKSAQSMKVRDRVYFTLALRYGLRASEGRFLKLSHLKLDQNSVYIPRLKGSVSQFYPLRSDDKKLIEKWLKLRSKMKHSDSDFLFITDRTPCWSRMLPVKLFEKYSKLAQIEGHTCHSCRHSTAVNLLDQSVDLFDIKSWLGHKSIQSTLVYLQLGTVKTRQRMSHIVESL